MNALHASPSPATLPVVKDSKGRRLLKERSKNASEVSDAASVSVVTARNWMAGRSTPLDGHRGLLSLVYDIPIGDWECTDPAPEIPPELRAEDERFREETQEATSALATVVKETPLVDPHAAPAGVAPYLERMQFYTMVMRGELPTAEVRDMIKAAELLSKASGDFVKRVELVAPPATREEALARIEMLRRRVRSRELPAPPIQIKAKLDE